MIIKAKNTIYRREDSTHGVLLNVEIKDINTYYNRFDNTLNFLFGVFHNVEGDSILIDEISLVLNDKNKRTGYVQLPDTEGTGDTNVDLEDYYADKGNFNGTIFVDYGLPSIEKAKTFFTGGTLENPEIMPVNSLAKEWLLNTLKFEGKKLKEEFEFNA